MSGVIDAALVFYTMKEVAEMRPPFFGGDFTKRLKNLILAVVVALLLSQVVVASDLVLFSANVDIDEFPVEKIEFTTPEGVPENWYPLRAVSEYLPLSVSWDEATREVVVDSTALKMSSKFYTRRYDSARVKSLENQMVIVDGVTYCSAGFLVSHLTGVSFSMDSVLYFYDYDSKKSTFVNDLGDEKFAIYTNTALYELYLKSKEDYDFVREYLPGGVTYVPENENPLGDRFPLAFVYPYSQSPVCYVLGNYQYGAKYASTIYHEASHVYRARFGLDNSEATVKSYAKELLEKLTSAN